MTRSALLQRLFGMFLLLGCIVFGAPSAIAQAAGADGETIVLIRHGEKPPGGLGQLTCRGLNRSLALPSVLIGRYGKPDFIFAPNPSEQVDEGQKGPKYSYLRPLATIEPTAIRLGMPVNAQIGFLQIDELQHELLKPAYAHSLIFVAWEHIKLYQFAQQMLKAYATAPVVLPDWPNSDYETIYIFQITRTGTNGAPKATLKIEQEGLESTLTDTCPGP